MPSGGPYRSVNLGTWGRIVRPPKAWVRANPQARETMMKRISLIGAALLAATLTLIVVGDGAAQPLTVLSAASSAHTAFAAPTLPSSPDVILALSDIVDLERVIKATSLEEREKFRFHVYKPARPDSLG